MSEEWREEQNRCLREIERHQHAEKSYMNEGIQLLELARNAQSLFERQDAREKRRLLNFVLSNCTWDDGEVVATFKQPFDLLAETATIAALSGSNGGGNPTKSEIWLGREDSNLRVPIPKTGALTTWPRPIRRKTPSARAT
jgi:site-specific DNA recombinase